MSSRIARALMAVACLALPSLVAAQVGSQSPSQRPALQGGGPGQAAALTQEQRDAIRAMQEQMRKDTQAIRDRQRAARQKLQAALRAETIDEQAVKGAAGESAAAQADLLLLNRRRQAELKTLLTPEQLRRFNMAQRMRNQRPPAYGRMANPPGRPMMGAGRGNRQGFGPMRRWPGLGTAPGHWRQPGPMLAPGQPGPMGPPPGPLGPRPWRRWI